MRRVDENIQAAFQAAVQTELDGLYRTACRILSNRTEAEDAVQGSLDKAWRSLHKFDPEAEMRPWLFRILHNTCLDHLRSLARRKNVPLETEDGDTLDLPSERGLPDADLSNRQLGNRIETEISKLSPSHRAVVQLVIVEQLTYDEAAAILDVPIGTLRSRLNRARAHLCSSLGDLLDQPTPSAAEHQHTQLRLVK